MLMMLELEAQAAVLVEVPLERIAEHREMKAGIHP